MTSDVSREALKQQVRALGAAFLDGWFVVDSERRILDFNAQFRGLFSRSQARQLAGSQCCQFLALGVCQGGACLAQRCLTEQAPVRYDEITATREGDGNVLRVIASAAPLGDANAALVVLRDVSDAADVQRKYKEVHDEHTREKDDLRDEIARKTKELMDANVELNRIQKELMRFKKGLFGS